MTGSPYCTWFVESMILHYSSTPPSHLVYRETDKYEGKCQVTDLNPPMATSFMPTLFPQPLVPATTNSAYNAAEAAFYLVISPGQVSAYPPQGRFAWRAFGTLSD
jgi:hypothetical protein